MRLNHNAMAYTANNNLNVINRNLTKSMERLSSGYKVNKSSDDPAAKAIAQRMQAQLMGMERAETNANDGISLIQTAEGALNEIHSVLQRIRELAVKAANETLEETDKDSIQDEISQLEQEIDRISNTTDFNGRKLLNGELNKKGYTNKASVSIAEIGGDITPAVYGLNVGAIGTQAEKTVNTIPDTLVVTKEQAGLLRINGLSVQISACMTGQEVNQKIRDTASKIGIDYDASNGTFTTQQYGSSQYIKLDGSDEIKALLGSEVGGDAAYGTNAKVSFRQDDGQRIGFKETATIETQGNRITVTDKNGFKMIYDVNPAGEDNTGDVDITVLSAGPMVIQIGENEGQTLNINISKTSSESLEIDKVNIYTHEYATQAIDRLDAAIEKISSIRSALGAYQNRLDHTINNLGIANENLTSAVSRIQDTDMAEEITEYTLQNVLSQSALQMLMKSNARPEGLLQLFQR